MSDIDKNIEILKELIKNANIEDADMNECFGGEHIIAIDNVLKEFEETQAELKAKKEIDEMINKIKSELQIKDKMIDNMAYRIVELVEKVYGNKYEQKNVIELFRKSI